MFTTKKPLQPNQDDPYLRILERARQLLEETKRADDAFELAVINAERVILGLPKVGHNTERK